MVSGQGDRGERRNPERRAASNDMLALAPISVLLYARDEQFQTRSWRDGLRWLDYTENVTSSLGEGKRNNMCDLQKWRRDDLSNEPEDRGTTARFPLTIKHILLFPQRSDRPKGPLNLVSCGYRRRICGNNPVGAWSWPHTSIHQEHVKFYFHSLIRLHRVCLNKYTDKFTVLPFVSFLRR
jgi:hypothetical protein